MRGDDEVCPRAANSHPEFDNKKCANAVGKHRFKLNFSELGVEAGIRNGVLGSRRFRRTRVLLIYWGCEARQKLAIGIMSVGEGKNEEMEREP